MTTSPAAPSAHRFRSAATVPAVILDSVAVLGLLLGVIGVMVRGQLLVLLFVGALLGVTALPGAVLSSVAVVVEGTVRGFRRPVLVAVSILLSACSLAAGPVVLLAAWNAAPNAAADRLAPLERDVRDRGGAQICANGDAGRGPDNVSAWRQVYYRIPASAADDVLDDARANGYRLREVESQSTIRDGITAYGARSGAGELNVGVATRRVELLCSDGGTYGRTMTVPEGDVIVDLDLVLDAA